MGACMMAFVMDDDVVELNLELVSALSAPPALIITKSDMACP